MTQDEMPEIEIQMEDVPPVEKKPKAAKPKKEKKVKVPDLETARTAEHRESDSPKPKRQYIRAKDSASEDAPSDRFDLKYTKRMLLSLSENQMAGIEAKAKEFGITHQDAIRRILDVHLFGKNI